MHICVKCGTSNEENRQVCKQCGVELTKPCPVCGAEMNLDGYCPYHDGMV